MEDRGSIVFCLCFDNYSTARGLVFLKDGMSDKIMGVFNEKDLFTIKVDYNGAFS
jgi:hypothetical protein